MTVICHFDMREQSVLNTVMDKLKQVKTNCGFDDKNY